MGQYETAIKYEKQAMAISSIARVGLAQGFLAFAYGKSGQKEKAMEIIAKMIEARNKGVRACYIGLAYCGIGRDDEALLWLEEAYQDHDVYIIGVATRPLWGELHWDPRYQKILKQMKLPLQLEYIRKALDKMA
jgi:tetratricopeptide (TPR) repeat protein